MFKKILVLVVITFALLTPLNAEGFSKMATVKPVLTQKGPQKPWCSICGMNIKMFYKTSHSAKTHNHKNRQYCSIRCLVVDMQQNHIDKSSVKVVDAKTQKTIVAKDAFYVVGSKVKGTMSRVSKLAFAKKSDAKAFMKKFGGKIVSFDTALAMAKKSLSKDIAMLNKKKAKKIYPMGKKIYTKMCNKNIDLSKYTAINRLKADIKDKHLCKSLNEKQLQVVSLYLFETKKSSLSHLAPIKVTHDEKCPVCGMYVYKYPRWAAQIFYGKKHYSFDGVKDLVKYYQKHKKGISKILVTDYYSQKTLDATKAYYVVGSNVYGPMGDEFIPFKTEADASRFMLDHKGTKILKFNEIHIN